eukprot:COSAG01_NODE_7908_length_2997_cov_10.717046_4_plen_47_part_00
MYVCARLGEATQKDKLFSQFEMRYKEMKSETELVVETPVQIRGAWK